MYISCVYSGRYKIFSNRGRGFFVLNSKVNFGHTKTLAFIVVNPACIHKSEFC